MKLICIDTCTKALSVAALQDGVVLAQRFENAGVNHSLLLMPMLSEMMETLGWDAKDVDIWAAVSGPGSFTGVRIGVSSIRALAHGWKKQVAAVNTLETLAMNLPLADCLVIPMLDARRDQVYAAAYCFEGELPTQIVEPCAASLGDFLVQLPKDRKLCFIGDGATAHKEELEALGAFVAPAYLHYPNAACGAVIAYDKASKGDLVSYSTLEPLYLRQSQAQQALQKKEAAK